MAHQPVATFSVCGWETLQHYKHRNPPWVRLHSAWLDSYEFTRLPDASKAHFLAIILLASRYQNEIPLDAEWVSAHIHASEAVDLQRLIDAGLIQPNQDVKDASTTLATRKQNVTTETEAEDTESESLGKGINPLPRGGRRADCAPCEPDQVRSGNGQASPSEFPELPAFLDKRPSPAKQTKPSKPKTKRRSQIPEGWQPDEAGRRFAAERGYSAAEIEREVSKFVDFHRSRGNVFADQAAAWRTWVQKAVEITPPKPGAGGDDDDEEIWHQF